MGLEPKTGRLILSQSLFNTAHAPNSSWRSYITSSVVHAVLVLALLLITFPVVRNEINKPHPNSVMLIAPPVPEYRPPIVRVSRIASPTTRDEAKIRPFRTLKEIRIKPVEVAKPRMLAATPEVKAIAPTVVPEPLPEPKLIPAPKPEVRTGTFRDVDAAKAQQIPTVTKVGGFGDPQGVQTSPSSRPSEVMIAKTGSFDLPVGSGNAGGGGRNVSGGVRQTSFGNAGTTGGSSTEGVRGRGRVQTGAFGESLPPPAQPTVAARRQPLEPAFTPVEIQFKPKPIYTAEARALRLQGQVSLDVVFLSSGSVRIVRVVHGLGHGLDEAAESAAQQVRFKPATRGGVPVDTNATIHISFELS